MAADPTSTARPARQRAGRDTSLGRGLAILLALGSDEAVARGGLGVVRIAAAVGREKSQVSRALRTLAESGLVERDPDTLDYRLGWRFFTLAARAGHGRLLTAAAPVLDALVASLGETAHLSVLEGAGVLTVLSQSSPRAVRASDWSGHRVPAFCTSAGRALLFDHDDASLAAVLADLSPDGLGPNAPRDAADVARRLAADRERGFAVADEELEPGLLSAAAPVRDFRGLIVAAVNVSGPSFRFGEDVERTDGPRIRAAADELSTRLGWAAPAPPGAG